MMKRLDKVKLILNKVFKNILKCLFGICLIMGFFFILGLIEQIIEEHFWLIIPLAGYLIILILKEI